MIKDKQTGRYIMTEKELNLMQEYGISERIL
jgi:hypothetical protein